MAWLGLTFGGCVNLNGGAVTGSGSYTVVDPTGLLLIKAGAIKDPEYDEADLSCHGGVIDIEGGTLGLDEFSCLKNGTINVFGGHVAARFVRIGRILTGTINLFGGLDLTGEDQRVHCEDDGILKIFGTEFKLLDIETGDLIEDLTATMQVGVPVEITDREVTLEAQFAILFPWKVSVDRINWSID